MSKGLKIALIILLVLFIVGAGAVYLGWRFIGGIVEKGPEGLTEMFEKYGEDVPFDLPEDIEDLEDFEDLYEDPVEEPAEKENPYDLAEEVIPMTREHQEMDENIKRVLGEVFEKEPKLTGTGAYYDLTYTTDRVITARDIQEIGNLFQEEGFKTEGETKGVSLAESRTSDGVYSLRFDVDDRERFRVIASTTKEGSDTQLVKIRIGF